MAGCDLALFAPYAERMVRAASNAERKAIVADMRRMYGFSIQKAYDVLHACGWESGRARRKDAGTTSVDEEALTKVAALGKHSERKNGKTTMPVNVSRAVAESNGVDIPVGNSRLRQLLRERELSGKSLKAPPPHTRMRSLYPNHVHFVDPSLSLLYFTPGKQHILRDDEVYKNKPFLEGMEDLKCWRYVLTDHYSSTICVRYYAARGETAENMYDFLLYAWGRKETPSYVFHGVPELLFWDKGSGNQNRPTTAALRALRVRTETHRKGNPRAKGQVEGANNIVETHFECLLKLEAVQSLEELNEAAERWCAAYNANELPSLDTRLHRAGMIIGVRTMLWQRITGQQLRELPDKETCRQIFTTGALTRKVAGDLTVRVVHPKTKRALVYSLADLPGIVTGQEVTVQPVLVDPEPLIIVSCQNGREAASFEVKPVEYDAIGFDLGAAVIGEEYKAQKETRRERNVKTLEKITGDGERAVPFAAVTDGAGFKTHSLIRPRGSPFIRQSEGTPVSVAETVRTHEILISAVEAAKRLKAECGEVPDGFINALRERYPEGVPVRAVDDLIKERKPKAKASINARDWIIEGGAAAAPVVDIAPAAERQSKIA